MRLHTSPAHASRVAALGSAVTALATTGAVSAGQASSLLGKLGAVSRQLNNGNKTAAANLLQAFINDVRALMNAGIISAADRQTLINSVQSLINQLKT